ncbi:hypothetical protein [Candidatus Ichthyocystis sparus]|uniref:hypothetical protein n=1 Tax=Candidatus Ichthyocystis sparus TaxID=1561004 RepID=UPI001F5F43BB|nr:hypothetical protein [Candidatus Ichthyocystis sparus]
MKRKLSSTSSGESSLNGNDGGSSNGQVQQSSALELEQSTGSAEEEGFPLDQHLAQIMGMLPGEKLFRSMFYGSPRAPYISDLVDQLLSKQEELLRRGQLGEGTSSSTQHDMSESLSLARYNARVIRALVSSIEAPASLIIGGGVGAMHGQAPGASHGQGPSASHWQDPGASHWQDPGASHWQAPGASHWQDPGASHWQAPGASHWQAPGASHWQAPGASHWQDPGTSHWQDPGTSHWQDPGTSHWQDPGASHWQDPGASHWQDPGASHWQGPSAPPGRSTIDSDTGFVLEPYLASALGMQPGEGLFRGMFHGTQQSRVVLGMIDHLSGIQGDLLRNQELERAGVMTQGESRLGYGNTASLIATNEELLAALMASIEGPTETVPSVVVDSNSDSESESRTLAELEEERSRRLARSQARLERKKAEQGVVLALCTAKLREKDLREVKNRVGVGTREPGVAMPSSLREIGKELIIVTEKKRTLGSVLGVASLGNLQEMRGKLEEVKVKKIELDRVGVGESAAELVEVRARQQIIEGELERARDRVAEVETLERETDELLEKEVELEATGASEEEIEKVKTRQAEISSRLIESEAVVENARERGIELEQLRERERELGRMVDIEERGLELDRLRTEARVGATEEEIELALELEGTRVRIRGLELELSIERELMIAEELRLREAKRKKQEEIKSRAVPEETPGEIIIMEESEEERANRLAALEAKMISDGERRAMERFATQEEDEEKEKAKKMALAQARRREKRKMDEVRSGKRVVVGSSIPDNIMRDIEKRSAAIVKALIESKAMEDEEVKAAREAKEERERVKAEKKVAEESKKAEIEATKERVKASARAAKEKKREEIRVAKAEAKARLKAAEKAARERERAAAKAAKEKGRAAEKAARDELKAMRDRQREEMQERIRAMLAETEREEEEEKDKDKQGKQ